MKLKFTPKVAIIATFFLLFSFSSFSQLTREFHITKVDNTLSDTVVFSVWGKNLTNIVGFQFSINWDSSKLTYVSSTLPTTNFGIIPSEINIPKKNQAGTSTRGIGVLHFDNTLLGQNVADSTVIMTFSLAFTNGYSKNVIDSVVFGSYPVSPFEVDTTDGNFGAPAVVASATFNGYVSTPFEPTISHGISGLLVANTGATVPPVSYQWLSCSGPCGPGSAYSAIPGATSSTYVGKSGVSYQVVAVYANGDRDTSPSVQPVKLTNFNGKNKERSNILTWNAANEFGVSSYIIERSNNGSVYTEVGSVKALGKTNDYSFTDDNLNTSFAYYYRLKMVDVTGSIAYSSVVKLNKHGKLVFQVQPNPIENSTINVYGNNMKQAKVYDNFGRLLLNTLVTNPDQASFKMNNLTKGVYMINIVSADGISQTEKFTVK